jgi:superfamily II DNA or RNA helicase
VIAVALLKKWPGKRVLWVAHRIELLRQAVDQLKAAGVPGRDIGILSGPDKANPGARILVASIDMMRSQPCPKVDVIVVDEAHRVMAESYLALIRKRPRAIVLGLTATVWRLDGEPLGDVFDAMRVMAEAFELIHDGWIARPVCYGLPDDKARSLTKGVTAGKDFAQGKLSKAMSKLPLMGNTISEWKRLANGKRTIVFAVNHEHAAKLFKRFKRAKVAVEYLRDNIGNDGRKGALKRLASGKTRVIVNVDVLSEGYDCPNVECIVMARPTKSLTRFLQQCGRDARPSGKWIVIDHAGNVQRFGYPDTPRDWSLEDVATAAGSGSAPTKTCCNDACRYQMPTGCRECPECGAEQPLSERELSEKEAELKRLERSSMERAALDKAIRALSKQKRLPASWIAKVLERIAA